MQFPKTKKISLAAILAYALVGLLIGLFFIFVNTEFLLRIVFVIMGIITVIVNLSGVLIGLAALQTSVGKATLLLSLLSVIAGFLMIFWHATLLMILLGVYMVVFPLLQIAIAKDKKSRLRAELPKIIIGIVLLILGPSSALGAVFDVVGWILLILTAIYTAVSLLSLFRGGVKPPNKTGNRIFVDHTGDGKIDTVYFDTTGDGKVDSSADYRDEQK